MDERPSRERYERQPMTKAGERFTTLAEHHAADAARRAGDHDRKGTFPVETFREMQQSGFLAACIPEDFGGLGVTSCTDLAAGFNRLARGDGATALAAHMHTVTAMGVARFWRGADQGGGATPAGVEGLLRALRPGGAMTRR